MKYYRASRRPVNSNTERNSFMKKQELLQAVQHAARVHSTATVFFHHSIAQRFGLGVTDEKALDVLVRLGPLTAGEIAQHTGLAGASVTSLIDRLEKRGFARRTRDSQDRRRVIVELNHDRLSEMAGLFESLLPRVDELFRPYTAAQLEVILDFLDRSTEWLRQLTERIEIQAKENRETGKS